MMGELAFKIMLDTLALPSTLTRGFVYSLNTTVVNNFLNSMSKKYNLSPASHSEWPLLLH